MGGARGFYYFYFLPFDQCGFVTRRTWSNPCVPRNTSFPTTQSFDVGFEIITSGPFISKPAYQRTIMMIFDTSAPPSPDSNYFNFKASVIQAEDHLMFFEYSENKHTYTRQRRKKIVRMEGELFSMGYLYNLHEEDFDRIIVVRIMPSFPSYWSMFYLHVLWAEPTLTDGYRRMGHAIHSTCRPESRKSFNRRLHILTTTTTTEFRTSIRNNLKFMNPRRCPQNSCYMQFKFHLDNIWQTLEQNMDSTNNLDFYW